MFTKGTPTNDVKMQNFVYITFNAPYLFEVHTINLVTVYQICFLFNASERGWYFGTKTMHDDDKIVTLKTTQPLYLR